YQTNFLVNRDEGFWGTLTGRASATIWTFGDGQTATNTGMNNISHRWTNSGDYSITYTAYNNDNPAGVSTNLTVHVQPLNVPQLQSAAWLTDGFQFQFNGQLNANYVVQYSTNLTPPVAWQTLQNIYFSTSGVYQITDPATTNATRFYRVGVQ
ncbi:MAG TPA: PKD domain-containing protein, partial [Verrucomicrobiae bacterium]